jgi:SAM-dependent methyltransferase
VEEFLRPKAGDVVVDVGCGTAEIFPHLPAGIRYHGYDLSPEYIEQARARYGDRGDFTCADITKMSAGDVPPCNVALSFGVLHHLDDDGARDLLENLYDRLAPGGRLVTLDGAFEDAQSPMAKLLISKDRGRNVRTSRGYADLMPARFRQVDVVVRHDLLRIPYTHAIVHCLK